MIKLFQARILSKIGYQDKSIVIVKQALKKSPNDIGIQGLLQTLYRDTGDWQSFFDIYEAQCQLFPNDLSLRKNYGTALLFYFRYKEALPHFKFCIENWNFGESYSQALGNIHAKLGICYAYLEEWALASSVLSKAQTLCSWDADMIYGFLLLYQGTDRIKEIPKFLDDLITRFPKLYYLNYWRAYFTHYYLHDPKASLSWYERAYNLLSYRKITRTYFQYYYSTSTDAPPENVLEGYIDALVHSQEKAEKIWSIIFWGKVRLIGYRWDANQLVIKYKLLSGDFNGAKIKCLASIRKTSNSLRLADYSTLLANAQEKMGDIDEGILNARKSVQLNPFLYPAWDILALLYVNKKDWKNAIEAYEMMKQIDPLDATVYKNLGMCQGNIGNVNAACVCYEKSISLNPLDADAWIDLANTYLKMGKKKLATEKFREGLRFDWLDPEKSEETRRVMDSP